MDPDVSEERDFADQGRLTDMDMEEDANMLALLLKHMPSCIDAADTEQLVRDIPDQPPVARCCPFNLKGHRFRGMNRQVLYVI
jgi:hypothetical protein